MSYAVNPITLTQIEQISLKTKLFRYVEVAGMGGAQEFLRCVHNTTFCMCKLDVRIQFERDDINVKKLQSLLQKQDNERNRLRGS